ncbi:hypothetical protein [Beijerinckia sp. L45]|uniref:hypothetical protein n=1 Tax=Beijerinckia sp. L45 TaxID=1641855 RepID=UPI00131BE600|nr:hypothetical protein [Beijerinckia sp. L45]
MSFLSEDERATLKTSQQLAATLRAQRASALINPASGLANDYLNLFNEIVMLVEQLPNVPELIEDIMAWRPKSYLDYFESSTLPGSAAALAAYKQLDARSRRDFETIIDDLDRRATGSVAAVRRKFKAQPDDQGESLAIICERAGANIREALDKATMLVNHGTVTGTDAVQERTDDLMARAATLNHG